MYPTTNTYKIQLSKLLYKRTFTIVIYYVQYFGDKFSINILLIIQNKNVLILKKSYLNRTDSSVTCRVYKLMVISKHSVARKFYIFLCLL